MAGNKTKAFLETDRLSLRRFGKEDLDLLTELDTDPKVMRFIGDGKPRSKADIEKSLSRIITRYDASPGLGLWPAFRKDDDQFIGWFALIPLAHLADIEVGYRLLSHQWGQGFATEGTKALLAHGFGNLGLKEIVAIVDPRNVASKRVLEKCGLTPHGTRSDPYDPAAAKSVDYYAIHSASYRAQNDGPSIGR